MSDFVSFTLLHATYFYISKNILQYIYIFSGTQWLGKHSIFSGIAFKFVRYYQSGFHLGYSFCLCWSAGLLCTPSNVPGIMTFSSGRRDTVLASPECWAPWPLILWGSCFLSLMYFPHTYVLITTWQSSKGPFSNLQSCVRSILLVSSLWLLDVLVFLESQLCLSSFKSVRGSPRTPSPWAGACKLSPGSEPGKSEGSPCLFPSLRRHSWHQRVWALLYQRILPFLKNLFQAIG